MFGLLATNFRRVRALLDERAEFVELLRWLAIDGVEKIPPGLKRISEESSCVTIDAPTIDKIEFSKRLLDVAGRLDDTEKVVVSLSRLANHMEMNLRNGHLHDMRPMSDFEEGVFAFKEFQDILTEIKEKIFKAVGIRCWPVVLFGGDTVFRVLGQKYAKIADYMETTVTSAGKFRCDLWELSPIPEVFKEARQQIVWSYYDMEGNRETQEKCIKNLQAALDKCEKTVKDSRSVTRTLMWPLIAEYGLLVLQTLQRGSVKEDSDYFSGAGWHVDNLITNSATLGGESDIAKWFEENRIPVDLKLNEYRAHLALTAVPN